MNAYYKHIPLFTQHYIPKILYVVKIIFIFLSTLYISFNIYSSYYFNANVNQQMHIFLLAKAKSRKYQGVFEVKSRVKTWQIRGIWSQQLEHWQVPKWGTEPGVRKGKRSLLASQGIGYVYDIMLRLIHL